MVLTDDDFASLEAAVEEGRGVFDNLRKFLAFMLPTSLGQGLVVLVAVLLATELPVLPVQVLWVNLTTAVALGLVLAVEPLEPGVMRRPPVPPSRPLLTREMAVRVVLVSAVMVVGAFGVFHAQLGRGLPVEVARTAAVDTVVLVQVLYLLACRSLDRSVLAVGLTTNRWVPVSLAAMLGLQLLFTYAPVMHRLFHTAPIDAAAWALVHAVAVAALLLVEAEAWLRRRRARRPGQLQERALRAAQ